MSNRMTDLTRNHSDVQIISSTNSGEDLDVSIVIPLFNEIENVETLYEKIIPAVDLMGRNTEIIFVDDGSTDGTFDVLQNIKPIDPRVWVIRLRRNFGQAAAFSAGFDFARGGVIVTMDGDLQNDPADIPLLLEKIDQGYDIVSGWRVKRHDNFITRRLPSMIANALISRVTGVKLHDYGCSLKAYRMEVVKNIRLYGELHRFIPAIASWMGIQVAEVTVSHFPRRHGRSKYGLGRTFRVILDLITVKFMLNYATRPLQIFGLAGMLSLFIGLVISGYLTILRLFYNQALSDRPILLLGVLLIMLGVQLILMGLLGELIVRTYHESQDKPIYAVRDILGGVNEEISNKNLGN
ncbi:MAG: glycosyltransferase family 2 protein [Anaerolineales bacterium]|nr:glycosyltransferase family 2 protein [Anaerolineales bacterium]